MSGRQYHRLEIIIGPMFAGKTEELLRRARRYEIARDDVRIFNYKGDMSRSGDGKVRSHAGQIRDAVMANEADEIHAALHPRTNVVCINEAQFFGPKIVELARYLRAKGALVICSALDFDFRGEPFPLRDSGRTIGDLLVLADEITRLTAVCTHINGNDLPCSDHATRSQRLIEDHPAPYRDPIEQIGGSESYQARCEKHHIVPGRPDPHYS